MVIHVETLARRPRLYLWETWWAIGAGEVCRWLLWPHGHGLTWAVCGWAGPMQKTRVWKMWKFDAESHSYVTSTFSSALCTSLRLLAPVTCCYSYFSKFYNGVYTSRAWGCCESRSWQQDKDTKKFFENRNLKNLKTLDCRLGLSTALKGLWWTSCILSFPTAFESLHLAEISPIRSRKRTVDYLGGLWGGAAYRGPDLFLAHTGRKANAVGFRCSIIIRSNLFNLFHIFKDTFIIFISFFAIWQLWAASSAGGLGVTVRIFEVMMKCAEKQPLGQSELAHGCGVHRTLKTVGRSCPDLPVMSWSCPSKYHMPCENAEAEADEGSLAFGAYFGSPSVRSCTYCPNWGEIWPFEGDPGRPH